MGTHTNDVHTCTLCVPSGAHIHMTACTSLNFNLHPHTHTHTHTQISVQSQEDAQQSIWRKLPDVPYIGSAVCVVDGVLLAIGGQEKGSYGSKKTSAIYALHPVDQKWQQVGDMPFECFYVDTLLLSGGRLLVVDGNSSKRVLRVTVEGKPCKCYGQYY